MKSDGSEGVGDGDMSLAHSCVQVGIGIGVAVDLVVELDDLGYRFSLSLWRFARTSDRLRSRDAVFTANGGHGT